MENWQYFTQRFYQWEYRGRGILLSDSPVDLEPPFIPFIRRPRPVHHIDDGKRHTLFTKALEYLKGSTNKVVIQSEEELDYSVIQPYEFEDDNYLTALQLKFPRERKILVQNMKALLTMLSYSKFTLSFEILGTEDSIEVQFVCRNSDKNLVETHIKSFFPACTILEKNEGLTKILRPDLGLCLTDFGLREEFFRPLPTSINFNFDPLQSVLGALESLKDNQQAGIQILFNATQNAWAESINHSVTLSDGSSFFQDDPEAPKLAVAKNASPLFAVTIRTYGQAPTQEESLSVFEAVTYPLIQITSGDFNGLITLDDEEYDLRTRVQDIASRRSHRLGMLLNVDELLHFLHFPSESIHSNKLFGDTRTTRETPLIATGKNTVLGINPHNGANDIVTVSVTDRLKHTHILGATGTGKSTLIANLALQDIDKGLGLALIDPHGDLVDDILTRIPAKRREDVVIIDLSDTEYPIGLNILQAHNDIEKEILSSDLVASFRKLSTSWGDQMNAVFSNAILAMLESTTGGTLHDVRRFLIEKDFREKFLNTVTDPSVRYYWLKEFPLLKSNSIGPILTRLDTFLRPRTIRNMVVQQEGLDFENLINTNKIILVRLSQGLIGVENSYLLGSLILSKIHQAAFARQSRADRIPFFIYIDEFQNIITPSIKDMLSGVRKYNIGLVLSHQDLQQLQREDGELLNSVLGNCYTRVIFRVGEPDAKKLEASFKTFDAHDLQNLGRGEAIVRIEQPQYDCSIETIPLRDVSDHELTTGYKAVLGHSRETYAKPRALVETKLAESFVVDIPQQKPPKERPVRKEVINDEIPQQSTLPETPQKEETPVIAVEELKIQPQIQREIVEQPQGASTVASDPIDEPIDDQAIFNQSDSSDSRSHTYLQTFVKKMAEARGYVAIIEAPIHSGTGSVDLLLTKEGKTIAVEISNTTDPTWELHNIQKCLDARYDTVVSLSGDPKQLQKIKKKCENGVVDFATKDILFFTPDAFFSYLDSMVKPVVEPQKTIKGFRVNTTFVPGSEEEMTQKKRSIDKIVAKSIKRNKKK